MFEAVRGRGGGHLQQGALPPAQGTDRSPFDSPAVGQGPCKARLMPRPWNVRALVTSLLQMRKLRLGEGGLAQGHPADQRVTPGCVVGVSIALLGVFTPSVLVVTSTGVDEGPAVSRCCTRVASRPRRAGEGQPSWKWGLGDEASFQALGSDKEQSLTPESMRVTPSRYHMGWVPPERPNPRLSDLTEQFQAPMLRCSAHSRCLRDSAFRFSQGAGRPLGMVAGVRP